MINKKVFTYVVISLLLINSNVTYADNIPGNQLIGNPVDEKIDSPFNDSFSADKIDIAKWVLINPGNLNKSKIDIKIKDKDNGCLRLYEDVTGTKNISEIIGLRSLNPVMNIENATEIKFDVDWNKVPSMNFMSTGIYICPTATTQDPEKEPNWIRLTYHHYQNKPDGSGFIEIYYRMNNSEFVRSLFDELAEPTYVNSLLKVPEKISERKIGIQHMKILFSQKSFTLWENDKKIIECRFKKFDDMLPEQFKWSNAYLYLINRSSNDSSPHEVYFDNISVCQSDPLPLDSIIDKPVLTTEPTEIPDPETFTPGMPFKEDFSSGKINWARWRLFRVNDFRESIIEVKDKRLRLHLDTMGTQIGDKVGMKYHGLRTVNPIIDMNKSSDLCFSLDWNNPKRAFYQRSGIILCPTIAKGLPGDEPDWIKLEYCGLSDDTGKAYLKITIRQKGNRLLQYVYNEFSNSKLKMDEFSKKVNRSTGKQNLRVKINNSFIELWENDVKIFNLKFIDNKYLDESLNWKNAYLYLFQNNQSDYKNLDVYFSDISINQSFDDVKGLK